MLTSQKHLIIPDCQVKPDIDVSYLRNVGLYIIEKKPDVVVCLGDFADMPSLSSYDVGKKTFEGRRYHKDIEAARKGMETLLAPLWEHNKRQRNNKKSVYNPHLVMLYGNHEDRISRAVESDPKLDGTLSLDDLHYEGYGWECHPFLEVVTIDGVCYSHYFTSGVMGRPVVSARQLVIKKHLSCVMGHVQKFEIYTEYKADGTRITGMFAGSCYEHNEDYLGAQGNNYFRGIHVLHNVHNGEYDHMAVSLDYLKKRYATNHS